ncbi:unnamed protein product [Alopecurus aequalis]
MPTLHFCNKTGSKLLYIPSLGVALVLLICLASPTSSCTEQEKGSLLQFLAGLSQDGGLAASWRNGTDCCKWEGITCRQDRMVTDVLLVSKGLEGHISQSLGTLTRLQHLDLSHNMLSGGLPLELVSSSSLTILDVSFNQLNGTLGELPSSTPARPLQVLNISTNLFTGEFPSSIWKVMENLVALNGSNNSFTGQIPTQLCNTSPSVTVLDLCFNKFSGSIPPGLGDCSRLRELRAGYNNLSGKLPDELFNATSLEYLSFPNNKLHGFLADTRIINLRNLETLDLGGNRFTGKIPDSIGQLTKLKEFHLNNNKMSGELPSSLSNCTNLVMIDLKNNNFSGELTKVNFSNLPNLKTLDLYLNHFNGTVPESIYSCSNLAALRLAYNNLSGQLSPKLSNLKYLAFLSLTENSFKNITNTIHILKRCRNLTTLLIALNFRGEIMPEADKIDGFENLQVLSIGELLNLSHNKFTGEIPFEIGQLKALLVLNFSYNRLTGQIPQSICNLKDLLVLDLSINDLTAAIPTALNSLHFLSAFNISHNDLEGPIPSGGQFNTFSDSSYDGNPKLCGSMLTKKCHRFSIPPSSNKQRDKKAILAIALGVFFGGLAILLLLGRLLVSVRTKGFTSKNRMENNENVEAASFYSSSDQTLVMMRMPWGKGDEKKLKFTDILIATNNFDKENVIGCGGYGLVYKAELPDGSKLAIKKLNSEMCLMEREFSAEVDALSMAQHENLVPLWGYCVQGNSRFLVYSYMENGSLDDWLHNKYDDASSFLDWPTRLKIAKGASLGLSYIHDVCSPQIVHRDIKSSNILLDKEFKAYVADFGLARLIFTDQTHVTTELVGTMGYIPPEYGQGWVATLRGDMYSFGVVLLELLTGMRPVPVLSTSKELVPWVLDMRSEGKQAEVLDPALRGTGYEEQMLKVLEAACKCVDHNQFMRPTIMEVASCLASIDADLHM